MYLNFNTKQLVYIFLLILLIFVVAIRSSLYGNINERFADNAFTIDIVKKQSFQSNLSPSSTTEPEISDEEKARREWIKSFDPLEHLKVSDSIQNLKWINNICNEQRDIEKYFHISVKIILQHI